ncbi:MAG: RtcB family protein [Flammeovirgaceae bacterium]|nr:RtcB family protein [Flammeovirgaceae bacterium]
MGYPQGKVIGLAINLVGKAYKRSSLIEKLDLLKSILEKPENFLENETLGRIAEALIAPTIKNMEIPLKEEGENYPVFGSEQIEEGARKQMDVAMKLPVTIAGALMPDAHQGYGLPIGGVLATENSVIPFGVGVDIGCRMCLSIYQMPENYINRHTNILRKYLGDNTVFGAGNGFDKPMDDAILDRKEFNEISVVRGLKDKAYKQIGSSGSGNHFVEFGEIEILDESNEFNLPIGKYVGVLSHSGSRGLGATIAKHFTDLAISICHLPKEAKHLAWLDLDKEEGMEYWLAMNLAGDYASACHDQIHKRLGKALGEKPLAVVENHHNFAWKEMLNGKEVIVHRKGATPAQKDVLGIIPGSMTAPGFIVRGKGNEDAINSASHGAGRQMSRRQARESITKSELKKLLKSNQIDLIGGGLDEAPIAYKDINKVMSFQKNLIEVIGKFTPRVVRMDGD